jgi:hypothetical protein
LDHISIDLSSFYDVDQIIDEINFASYTLSMSSTEKTELRMAALSILRLVECNPHVKKLVIYGIEDDYTIDERMIAYLSQHCREVKDVKICTASAESVRLVMASFPSLQKINWRLDVQIEEDSSVIPVSGEITCYPNIESFEFYDSMLIRDLEMATALNEACPNLTHLKSGGPQFYRVVRAALTSCRKLTNLSLYLEDDDSISDQAALISMMSAIAQLGLQLKDLSIQLGDVEIDISDTLTRTSMITTIQRLQKLDIEAILLVRDNDAETTISSLFSSPGVDLRSLDINTCEENADQIAVILRGCGNAHTLILQGEANLSDVMMKISLSCHQLVDLKVDFYGEVTGEAMRALLQSCRQMKSLSLLLWKPFQFQAYEALALHGGNITSLVIRSITIASSTVGAFIVSSPLYDPGFKQQRKHPMMKFICEAPALDVKSLAKFLSCFGVIGNLAIKLSSSQLPVDFKIGMYDEIPIYHARTLSVSSTSCSKDRVDAVFLAMMTACRSLRTLRVESDYTGRCAVDAATLLACAFVCKLKMNLLESLACPKNVDQQCISKLKELLPELKHFSL